MVDVSGSVTFDKVNMMKSLGIQPSSLPHCGHKTGMKRVEGHVFQQGEAEYTLAEMTGSGTVVLMWMAIGFYAPLYESHLKLTVDGVQVADVDLATLWAYHHYWTNPFSPRRGYHWNRHLELNIGDEYPTYPPAVSMIFRFPIYFSNGFKAVITNPRNRYDWSVFGQIFYTQDFTLPYRLYIDGYNWTYYPEGSIDQGKTILGGQTNDLLSIAGEGLFAYFSMVAGKQGSFLLLENDMEVYIDNESQPSIKSTGLEDWFLSGWYFEGADQFHYSSPITYVPVKKAAPDWWINAAIDLTEAHGGIAFNNKLDLKLDCSESAGFEMGYSAIYYKKV